MLSWCKGWRAAGTAAAARLHLGWLQVLMPIRRIDHKASETFVKQDKK
jgi:hypothetical protein